MAFLLRWLKWRNKLEILLKKIKHLAFDLLLMDNPTLNFDLLLMGHIRPALLDISSLMLRIVPSVLPSSITNLNFHRYYSRIEEFEGQQRIGTSGAIRYHQNIGSNLIT